MTPFETQFDHILDVELPLKSADFARLTALNDQDQTTLLRLEPARIQVPATDLGFYLDYLDTPFTYAPAHEAYFSERLTGKFFLPKFHRTYELLVEAPERVRELIQSFLSVGDFGPPKKSPRALSEFSFFHFDQYLYDHLLDAFLLPTDEALVTTGLGQNDFERLTGYLERIDSPIALLLKKRWNR